MAGRHRETSPEIEPSLDALAERRGVVLESGVESFDRGGVLNPAVVRRAGVTHLFYRAVDIEGRSSIGHAQLDQDDRIVERLPEPILDPEYEFERGGIEDPRITELDGIYYLIYCAWDGQNARLAMAVSDDLETFEKVGQITPDISARDALAVLPTQNRPAYGDFAEYLLSHHGDSVMLWDKDAYMLPRKSDGQYVLFHRIFPDIQAIRFPSFSALREPDFWLAHLARLDEYAVLRPERAWETRHVGGGAPPVRTPEGWLHIYHGVTADRRYSAGAFLTSETDPVQTTAISEQPILTPTTAYEREGAVPNIVFPSGCARDGERLDVYYGAADQRIAVAQYNLSELLRSLRPVSDRPTDRP